MISSFAGIASLLVVHIFKALTESCDKLELGSVRDFIALLNFTVVHSMNQEVSDLSMQPKS